MAATVIDELVISLSLNAQNFTQQQQQAIQQLRQFQQTATQTATVGERAAQKMIDGFSRLTKEVLGVGAAILGVNSLKELAVKTVDAAAGVERLATALDINPVLANKWSNLMRVFAGQAPGVTVSALGELKRAVEQFQLTSSGPFLEARPTMTAMGLRMPNINEKPDKFIEQFLLALGEAAKLPKNRDNLSYLLSNIPGMSALNLGLRQPNLAQELDRLQTLTKEQVEAADKIKQRFSEAAIVVERQVNKLLIPAERAIEKFEKTFINPPPGTPLPLPGGGGFGGMVYGFFNTMGEMGTTETGGAFPEGAAQANQQKQQPLFFIHPGFSAGSKDFSNSRDLPPVTINISTLVNEQNARPLAQAAADAFYDAIQGNAGLH